MNTIFYGINGEGLGHTTRALNIINNLNAHVEIFTYGDAYEFLKNQNYPFLNRIEGVNFHYQDGKVHPLLSIKKFVSFLCKSRKSINQIITKAKALKPILFITDFEPLISRVANRLSKKLVSIDNQHKFVHCGTKHLDKIYLKLYANLVGLIVKTFIYKPDVTIISTFHYDMMPTFREGTAKLVGPFLPEELTKLPSTDENFTLVYCKHSTEEILDKIKPDHKIKVYGSKTRHVNGFEYHDLSRDDFIKDLTRCSRVITTGGNQLLGEARHFGKPCFVVPIPNQHEQEVNAYFAAKLGNVSCKLEDVTEEKISSFVHNYKSGVKNDEINGLPETIRLLTNLIEEAK